MSNCDPQREIRIRRFGKDAHEEIANISAHVGIAQNKFIRPLLSEIADSFPQHMKEAKACEPCKGEMRLRGVSKKVRKELQAVADFIGVDLGDLLKVELARKSIQYPAGMKTKMAG